MAARLGRHLPSAICHLGPVSEPLDETEQVEELPGSLWQRLRAEPERAPEHLALAAAERFAPPAERWAALMTRHHTPADAARIAYRKHVRRSGLEGAAAGLGGALTIVPDLAALAWIQGRMVFFIAAAYGYDPRHPMRPAELLALQGIYGTAADARAALDGAGIPLARQYVESKRRSDEQLAARLVKLVGRKAAKRAVLKVVPVLSSPISAVQNRQATADLGQRALLYYGG